MVDLIPGPAYAEAASAGRPSTVATLRALNEAYQIRRRGSKKIVKQLSKF
jgi:hypothetical protein